MLSSSPNKFHILRAEHSLYGKDSHFSEAAGIVSSRLKRLWHYIFLQIRPGKKLKDLHDLKGLHLPLFSDIEGEKNPAVHSPLSVQDNSCPVRSVRLQASEGRIHRILSVHYLLKSVRDSGGPWEQYAAVPTVYSNKH